MKQAIVLGIGNRLMGDDGIGNCVVEELVRRKAFPDLRLIVGETDTDYCLDILENADNVILIDAANQGAEPCSVTVFSIADILKERSSSFYPHNFDLIHAMKGQPYGREGILIAIEACSITYRLGLSPRMQEQFPRIVDHVYQHIEAYINL